MDNEITIVVVDDVRSIRVLIEKSLDHLTKNIACFADCWSAWMYIKANRISLVISDVHMIGMNGLDLLQSIKRVYPQTKCLMISGDLSSKTRVLKLGADKFLFKPFEIPALVETVKDLCDDDGKRQERMVENSA